MFPMFVLGVALLLGVLLISRWYVSASPKTLVKALKWVGLTLVMCVIAWLALTGKLWAAAAALPAALVWFARLSMGLRFVKMLRGVFGSSGAGWSSPGANPSESGKSSEVRTRFVTARLDHATGHMTGDVLDGRFRGRRLDDLNLNELLDLLGEAQADADSARLVESYLERRAPGWREQQHQQQQSAPPSGTMTRAEALRVLGLAEGASKADIKAAHRRLMAQVHPDHGGSDYLAQQINAAKDLLLGK